MEAIVNDGERIAKLEVRMDRAEGVLEKLDRIEKRLDRQQTFVGGVIFTVSALWAVVGAVWDKIGR